MKQFSEIVEAHIKDGDVDLAAILVEAAEEMGAPPQVDGRTAITLFEEHFTYALEYIGNLALGVANEVGALPDGLEEARADLALALQFDKFRRLYELKRKLTEPKLVVPE